MPGSLSRSFSCKEGHDRATPISQNDSSSMGGHGLSQISFNFDIIQPTPVQSAQTSEERKLPTGALPLPGALQPPTWIRERANVGDNIKNITRAQIAAIATTVLIMIGFGCIVYEVIYILTSEANKVISCEVDNNDILLFFEGQEYFTTAFKSCQRRNSSILTPEDINQTDKILQHAIKTYYGEAIWLDYNFIKENGINDSSINNSTESTNDKCIKLSIESGNWSTSSCYQKYHWICRINDQNDCNTYI